MTACKICGNEQNNQIHIAHERMLGLMDEFQYLECGACGCLQLLNIPADMSRYYPADSYYSYHSDENFNDAKYSLSNYLRRIKSDYLLFGKHPLAGRLLNIGYKVPGYFHWLRHVGADYQTSILDLGSGGGELLFRLRRLGFKHLTGADPFIEKDINSQGVQIFKKDVFQLQGSYSFIMINHAFEHMEAPLAVLKKISGLLAPGGCLMIRIPVADSWAWKHYGEYWAPLDAPRHLYIHTELSMRILADGAGFNIRHIEHDSGTFQFWGSEQYKKGITHGAPNSYRISKSKSMFSKAQIKEYQRRIDELNAQQQGGDAVFYLYKK